MNLPNWLPLLIIGLVVVILLGLRFRGSVSAAEAQRHLREGALLVDVRTPAEFAADGVPGAVNIPLADLPAGITRHAPDQQRVLLVHCQSGGRSAVAAMKLRSAGYARVFNLGSVSQARKAATR
jgi:phage shock protein E